jgi:hypothetical protein
MDRIFNFCLQFQALGRHEEAFQAFYECLTLEDEKAAKQVNTFLDLTLILQL